MISQPQGNHLSSQNNLKNSELSAQQIKKQIQKLQQSLIRLKKKNPDDADFDDSRKRILDQHYAFPASIQKAEKHREAFKIGKDPKTVKKITINGKQQDSKCACCLESECQETVSCIPLMSQGEIQSNNAKTSQMKLYFTILKGLILFLIIRFSIYDYAIIRKSVSGFYCSDLFKNHTGRCTYTLSIYNLKGQPVFDEINLEFINTYFTILSIIFFILLKVFTNRYKIQPEKHIIKEDMYSLLVSNIPNYIITNKANQNKIIQKKEELRLLEKKLEQEIFFNSNQIQSLKDKINYLWSQIQKLVKDSGMEASNSDQQEIKKFFAEKVKKLIETKQRQDIKAQRQFLRINTDQKFNDNFNRAFNNKINNGLFQKKGSLLEQMHMEIVTEISFCYDFAEIDKINQLRDKIQLTNQQFGLQVKFKADHLNGIEILMQKKFKQHNQIRFHITHFSGTAIVSFQYVFFKNLILQAYQKDPQAFQINGVNLKISQAPKPGEISWQNMSETEQNRKKNVLHSWTVMIMILILSFAAFACLQLIEKRMEVTSQETLGEKFLRYTFSLFSAGVASLINKGLGYAIQNLVKMEKHTTKFERQNSLIIKNLLAQSFNSLFIFIIIYLINPTNPLGSYGLAEKAISLAIASNLITLFFQLTRLFQAVWQVLKKCCQKCCQKCCRRQPNTIQNQQIDSGQPNIHEQPNKWVSKFQIQLNKQYQHPKFDQQGMYIFYTLMLFLVSMYGSLAPVITPIVLGFFIIFYYVDNYNAFKRSSLDSFDGSRADLILTIMHLSIPLSAISYFILDWSTQKEPKLSLWNLMCIFLAVQFAGFQAFVGVDFFEQLKQKVNKSLGFRSSSLPYRKAQKDFDKTYKSQNSAIKNYYTFRHQSNQNMQLTVQNKTLDLKQQNSTIKLITAQGCFKLQKEFSQQKDQKIRQEKCSGCKKAMTHGTVYNVFCGHQVCVFCFWNNIYYHVETLSSITCMFCQEEIDPILYMPYLEQRLKLKAQLINSKLHEPFKNRKNLSNLHLCGQHLKICEQNSNCKRRYCDDCHFQKHQPNDCQAAFKQRHSWLQCSRCPLIIQRTNKCYSHFGRQLLQTRCPICIIGWNDIYDHKCQHKRNTEPLSAFVNTIYGIFYTFVVIGAVLFQITEFLVLYAIFLTIFFACLPFLLIKWISQAIYYCQWKLLAKLTFLMPVPATQYLLYLTRQFVRTFYNYNKRIIELIKQLPFKIRDCLFSNLLSNISPECLVPNELAKFYSKKRRIAYSLVMLILLPLLFGLAAIFFVLYVIATIFFTLLFIPILTAHENSISIWICIFLYPIFLIRFLYQLYVFYVILKLVQLLKFYVNYTKTMLNYMFYNCNSNNQEETSLYEDSQDQSCC